MEGVLKEADGGLKEAGGVLKGLQGKNLTRKGIFDFLADIDLDTLYGKKENVVYTETGIAVEENITKPDDVQSDSKISDVANTANTNDNAFVSNLMDIAREMFQPKEIKCRACEKTFTVEASLRRHLERSTVCVNWNNLPDKIDGAKLTKGLHLIIDNLLEKAIGNGTDLECKHCKTQFTSKGNHHKHFNSSTVCNRIAFQEFKTMLNSL